MASAGREPGQPQTDEEHQREIWESRCPHLLAERDDALAECGRLRKALDNLTPSPDGGYGPNNAAAWKDEYIDRLREAVDAEREAGRLREQLDAAIKALKEIEHYSNSGEWHNGIARAALGVVGPRPNQGSAPRKRREDAHAAREETP